MKAKDYLRDLSIDEKIRINQEWSLKMWTGLIWIRMRSNGGFVISALKLWVPKGSGIS
jgi:hypothetical protein